MAVAADQAEGREGKSGFSNWMSELPDQLHDIPLWNLAIPGSHDAMSYDLDIKSSIMEPDQLICFSSLACVRQKVYNWSVTQEVNITEQLDAGIRYFDLRIARKPNDSDPTRLYFAHGLYTRTDTVLKEIKDWAKGHPKEILILALSHFHGIDKSVEKEIYGHLIKFIKDLFGAKLFPTKETPTLKLCWESGRNVIVSLEYPRGQEHDPDIRGGITYYYGNSMYPEEIKSKLDHYLTDEKRYNSKFLQYSLYYKVLWITYIISLSATLVKATEKSLPSMLEWVKKQTPGDGEKCVNIIASDLVNRDDFVSTVIKLNDKLLKT
uniref:Phosphatidylinositol-specific phospholipase C X domain-containing protein n=1 Tax=Myripristis murdjan TaxID=586833 RepID=A0A667YQW1_9TELE